MGHVCNVPGSRRHVANVPHDDRRPILWDMENWHLAHGFRYAGVHCGLRPDPQRPDLALIASDRPAAAAGVFTQNRVCAAPVQVCRERLPSHHVRGIVVCSGNANACTGTQGLDDARRMTELAGAALDVPAEQMLVCSTGVIGRPLPMDLIGPGIAQAGREVAAGSAALERAARAILTTDTRIKVSTRTLAMDGREVAITGFAKGAAMIGPNMATMLAFVLSDAAVLPGDLAALARQRGRLHVQLRKRRRAYQHERFADLAGERRRHAARRCRSRSLRRCGDRRMRRAGSCHCRRRGGGESSGDDRGGGAAHRRRGPRRRPRGRQQRPGEDRDLRGRSELGPHRVRGGLQRRRVSRSATCHCGSARRCSIVRARRCRSTPPRCPRGCVANAS